jgi:FixJ family two-component response regulator
LIPVISIVDDDSSVRNALDRLVRSIGLDACVFASAVQFLESPRLHDTRCVIADIQMPGMNGLELQRVLQVRSPALPVIFITAYPDQNARRQAMQAGAIGFLDKPFDGNEVVALIQRAIAA